MASFPLDPPREISLTPFGPDGFHVLWTGNACVYKLAYKRQDQLTWNAIAMNGPTFTSGSGYFTDDTPLVAPGAGGALASFGVDGLSFGVYDLRLINLAPDGSDYTVKRKFLVAEDVGIIPNLHLVEDPGGKNILNVAWDDPEIDSGYPIILSWCELDERGKKTNCESVELASSVRSYSLGFHLEQDLMIAVAQKHSDAQAAVSKALYVHVCPCSGTQAASIDEWAIGEPLVGTQNGVNTVFTTLGHIKLNSEDIKINGLTQERGVHYTVVNGNEIHFTDAPPGGEALTADYIIQK